MSKTKSFAEHEFNLLLKSTPDAVIRHFKKEIIALADAFGNSGQSGGSAPFVAKAISQAVEKLLLQKPICPITGITEEWHSCHSPGETLQNNRLSSLFKEGASGKPYYRDAIVFDGGITGTFTGNSVKLKNGELISSIQFIKKLPFTPKTFYIDVIETEWADKEETVKKQGGGWWTSVVKDESQLQAVAEYYDLNLKG